MTALLRLVLSLGLLVLGLGPIRAEELPSNVIDHDLGAPLTSLSIRLIAVPHYIGDKVVFEATVRNTSTRPFTLPDARALFVNEDRAPDDGVYFKATGIDFVRHTCPDLGHLDDVTLGPLECIDYLRKNSVRLGPGESRTATWASAVQKRVVDDPDVGGQSPVIIGVRISSHGILPDRWFRFRLYRFRDPIKGQVLFDPVKHYKRLFFTVPAGQGRYIVYGLGAWYPSLGYEPPVIDAAYINKSPHTDLVAVVTKPDPVVSFDEHGRVLVDGVPAPPRKTYQFEKHSNSRWALSEERPASTSPSMR